MFSKATFAGVAFAASALAAQDSRTYGIGYFWDSPLVEARMDPIIAPGQISSHVHTVVGGDGFGISMDESAAINSKCTQSRVNGDKSNYWFPALYHHNSDNTFTKVELDYVKAYYFFEPTDDEIKPFPPGFRMISGNPMARKPTALPWSENIDPGKGAVTPTSFVCPQQGTSNAWNSTMSTSTGQGPNLPDAMCNGQYSPLRYNVHFPSCIDTNAPLDAYQTNTVWATSEGSSSGKANCPEGYTHVPHLFIEAYWNTMDFTDWTPGQGKQPFVLAQGDPEGYGLHADFVSGWDTDVLSHLISTCNAGSHGDGLDSCPGVANHQGSGGSCTVVSANPTEQVNGTLDALPGCNPLQYGPEDAAVCDCSSGKPVCNGSSGGSTPPPSGGSSSSSAAATTTTTSAAVGGDSPASPTPTSVTSPAEASPTGSPGDNPDKSSGSGSDDDDDDDGDDGGDDDDDTCEPEPTPTPEPMGRRHARHLTMHKREFNKYSW